jgi:hypothetical protein
MLLVSTMPVHLLPFAASMTSLRVAALAGPDPIGDLSMSAGKQLTTSCSRAVSAVLVHEERRGGPTTTYLREHRRAPGRGAPSSAVGGAPGGSSGCDERRAPGGRAQTTRPWRALGCGSVLRNGLP